MFIEKKKLETHNMISNNYSNYTHLYRSKYVKCVNCGIIIYERNKYYYYSKYNLTCDEMIIRNIII